MQKREKCMMKLAVKKTSNRDTKIDFTRNNLIPMIYLECSLEILFLEVTKFSKEGTIEEVSRLEDNNAMMKMEEEDNSLHKTQESNCYYNLLLFSFYCLEVY
jgi:aspartyl/asparaginyl beta-hydroxylase (cupin superfamily)